MNDLKYNSFTKILFYDSYFKIYLNEKDNFSILYSQVSDKLLNANQSQRENFRIIGNFEGIHLEDLDEDLHIGNLIKNFNINMRFNNEQK